MKKVTLRLFTLGRQVETGSTLVWLFLWIVGVGAIAYWCATQHVPAIQRQIQLNAEEAVSVANASNVVTSVQGRTVKLKGTVANDSEKAELLNALSAAEGVRHINDDQLIVINSSAAVAQSNDTSATQPETTINNADTPTSNKQLSQNNGSAGLTPNAATPETASVNAPNTTPETPPSNAPSSETPAPEAAAPEAPSAETLAAVVTPPEPPSSDSPTPESPSPEAPPAETLAAEVTPPEPPSSDSPTPESPSPEAPSADALTPETPSPEAPSADAPAPETPSPETPSSESLAAEAPSPEAPSPQTPAPVEDKQSTVGDIAELAVSNETVPSNQSDAPSPEPDESSPSLIEVLEGESSTFSMQIKDGTLTLTGDISAQDDSLDFIQTAMKTFDVNYVVNSMQVNEASAEATWLPALTEFIPSMQPITGATINIFESQVTLSGIAPSEQIHDKIIDDALSILSELSLVDSIDISTGDNPAAAPTPAPQTAPAVEPAATVSQNNTQNTVQPASQTGTGNTTTTTAEQLSTLREAFKALEAEKILFRSGSNVLTEKSIQTVVEMSALLSKYADINIEIDGHTDSRGSSDENLRLSQLRANAVRDLMIENGIARERLSAYGFGDGVPIADNNTAAGRKLNRRIEFNF